MWFCRTNETNVLSHHDICTGWLLYQKPMIVYTGKNVGGCAPSVVFLCEDHNENVKRMTNIWVRTTISEKILRIKRSLFIRQLLRLKNASQVRFFLAFSDRTIISGAPLPTSIYFARSDQLLFKHKYCLKQCFTSLVIKVHCPACFRCLPVLTPLLQMIVVKEKAC